MAFINLSGLSGPEMQFLIGLKSKIDQYDLLDDVEEHWSNAVAEGEIRDGALLNALVQVAQEENAVDELQEMYE